MVGLVVGRSISLITLQKCYFSLDSYQCRKVLSESLHQYSKDVEPSTVGQIQLEDDWGGEGSGARSSEVLLQPPTDRWIWLKIGRKNNVGLVGARHRHASRESALLLCQCTYFWLLLLYFLQWSLLDLCCRSSSVPATQCTECQPFSSASTTDVLTGGTNGAPNQVLQSLCRFSSQCVCICRASSMPQFM